MAIRFSRQYVAGEAGKRVKPADSVTLSTDLAAPLIGGEVVSLARIAAGASEQRTEHFPFKAEDGQLVSLLFDELELSSE